MAGLEANSLGCAYKDLKAANPKNIKFGLVPFSHHVWVTLPKQYVKGQSGTGTWTGCTQDRKYPYNLTDATPTSSSSTKWGQSIAPVHASDGCSAYVPNNLKVAPLTDNYDALRTQLDKMKPYAWTHIALGAEFGFQLVPRGFAARAVRIEHAGREYIVVDTAGLRASPERLEARGMPRSRLAAMRCPIGIAGIAGKEPEVIAIAVAAELLQTKSGQDETRSHCDRRNRSPG